MHVTECFVVNNKWAFSIALLDQRFILCYGLLKETQLEEDDTQVETA